MAVWISGRRPRGCPDAWTAGSVSDPRRRDDGIGPCTHDHRRVQWPTMFRIMSQPLFRLLLAVLPAQAVTPDAPSDRTVERPERPIGRFERMIDGVADPSGVAIARDGTIYISDTANRRIRAFDRRGRPLNATDDAAARSDVHTPRGLAVAGDGRLYVVDAGTDEVKVLDRTGRVERAWGGHGSGPGQLNTPTGIAVRAGHVYVADTANHRVCVFDTSGRYERSLGGHGETAGRLNRPADVAVDAKGRVYVADTLNHRIQVFDVSGASLATWGTRGELPGMLVRPTGITVHRNLVFVADAANHRIQVFDTAGKHRYLWGKHVIQPHEGDGRLHYPSSVAVAPDGGAVVACEAFEDRCQVFVRRRAGDVEEPNFAALFGTDMGGHFGRRLDTSGGLLAIPVPDTQGVAVYTLARDQPILVTQFGGYGTGPDQFSQPAGVAFAASRSLLYVLDAGRRRACVFRLAYDAPENIRFRPNMARFVKAYDLMRRGVSSGDAARGFVVTAVRTGPDGTIYVLESCGPRVLMFDDRFRFTGSFGRYGTRHGEFRSPTDLTVNPDTGTVYVADAGNDRVQAFDATGAFRYAWGGHGDAPGRFRSLFGITVGADGHVYTTDAGAHRVQKFDAGGRLVADWGRRGIGPGEFFKPAGIAQDDRGRIIVLDHGNHRGQVFDENGKFLAAFGSRLYILPTFRRDE